MKLYEIDERILSIVKDGDDLVDMETGEIIDPEEFEALQMAQTEKVEGLLLCYKSLMSDAAAIKAEEKSLKARRESKEKRAASIKEFIETRLNGEKFETPRVKTAYRKTKSVEVEDMETLPDVFKRFFAPEPDKVAIKEALGRGIVVPGAHLVEKTSMTIK